MILPGGEKAVVLVCEIPSKKYSAVADEMLSGQSLLDDDGQG